MDRDHAKRVLEHQEKQQKRVLDPLQNHGDAVVIIQQLHDQIHELKACLKEMINVYWGDGDGHGQAPGCIRRAKSALVRAGYAIEPIEDEE